MVKVVRIIALAAALAALGWALVPFTDGRDECSAAVVDAFRERHPEVEDVATPTITATPQQERLRGEYDELQIEQREELMEDLRARPQTPAIREQILLLEMLEASGPAPGGIVERAATLDRLASGRVLCRDAARERLYVSGVVILLAAGFAAGVRLVEPREQTSKGSSI
jgi:hypothetical protein